MLHFVPLASGLWVRGLQMQHGKYMFQSVLLYEMCLQLVSGSVDVEAMSVVTRSQAKWQKMFLCILLLGIFVRMVSNFVTGTIKRSWGKYYY